MFYVLCFLHQRRKEEEERKAAEEAARKAAEEAAEEAGEEGEEGGKSVMSSLITTQSLVCVFCSVLALVEIFLVESVHAFSNEPLLFAISVHILYI